MRLDTIFKGVKAWIWENRLVMFYALLATLLELAAVFVVEGTVFLSRPFISLGILVFVVGIALMVKGMKAQFLLCCFFLVIQTFLDIVFVLIYDMTGQYFYYEMLNLRNDAVASLDSFPVNFFVFYSGVMVCAVYVIYGIRQLAKVKTPNGKNGKFWYKLAIFVLGICTIGTSIASYYPHSLDDRYKQMINGNSDGVYASYGMIGNFLGEFGSKMWEVKTVPNDETIENFLYSQDSISSPTDYFGISKDKNVVVILAESFEWFSFLNDERFNEEYPNALPFTKAELAALYPNLTRFYNESIVADNFHSREKTDIAETLSVTGCYPLDAYVTYDYPEVAMPMSLPNIIGKLDANIQKRSFHNGDKMFYNRITTHKSFGFDEEMMDKVDMEKLALEQAALTGNAPTFTDCDDPDDLYKEYNLDSEMIETCKDLMFPTDRRFFTYITSITMHGTYTERENIKEHHEKIKEIIAERMPQKGEDYKITLLNYMATAIEFDKAIGLMLEDLESKTSYSGKNMLDDTVILMFGDHNAYFKTLSNYVKDIDGYTDFDRKYTDLYNVPLMIYDKDLTKKAENKRFISKFTCTADIVPTLFDLLGIRYYKNFYYGNSVFSDRQSVLYSRAYDVFISDGIVAHSVANIVYCHDDVTEGQRKAFQNEAKNLVEKMKYTDYIFIGDWFDKLGNTEKFEKKMYALQGIE